jgi:hypothetical protein
MSTMMKYALLLALGVSWGCLAPSPKERNEPMETTTSTLQSQPKENGGPAGDGVGPATRHGGTIDLKRVQWPDAASCLIHARAALTSSAREQVDNAVLPVLLPSDAALAHNATVIARPTFIAVSTRTDDKSLTVSVSASNVVHRYQGMEKATPTSKVRGGKPAWVLQNEGIWSVAWNEHGIDYVLELECAAPGTDARCADDTAVRQFAEELVFVGGSAQAVNKEPSR